MPVASTDWQNLLQQSSDLVTRDGQGLPWVQRNLGQVEEFSQRLKARSSRLDASEDRIAASRLLASEGLNAGRLARELDAFEMKPSYEDVFQVETATVGEYLKQVHDMTLLTSLQQAQRDNTAAFEDFMDQCMEMDWGADKRDLFESILPAGLSSQSYSAPYLGATPVRPLGTPSSMAGVGTPLSAAGRSRLGLRSPASASPYAAPSMFSGGLGGASGPPEPTLQLEPRAQAYLDVVKAMQAAEAQGQPFNAVAEFAKASEKGAEPNRGAQAVSVRDCWTLLARMVEKLEGASGRDTPAGRASALLVGARQHLEAGHANYIQAVIQRNVAAARLGGSPSRLERVRALLRVMLKDEGVLDFDGGTVPTTWRQLYYCVRSGFYAEVKQVAAGVTDFRAGDLTTPQFMSALESWLATGAVGDESLVGKLRVECQKLLADRGRPTTSGQELRQKLQLLTVLAGDRASADQLLRDAPQMFPTIEDFMWFRIALIRPQATNLRSSSTAGSASYSLADLQEYLCKYPSSHYSKDGKEPLLYATVLLLSLQFRQAITYLTKEATAQSYRIDALHIAASLVHHGLADAGGDSDAGSRGRGIDFAAIFHDYAQNFVREHSSIALEYYMLAASTQGASGGEGTVKARASLLRELLLKSGDLSLVAQGGPLSKFVPSAEQHQELLSQVAHECQLAAQLDEAVELYMEAKRPVPALAILNRRISNLMDDEARGAVTAQKGMDELVMKGRDAMDKIGQYSDSLVERRESEAFTQLLHVREVIRLSAQAKHAAAVQKLSELQFIPLEVHRVEKCAADIVSLHQVVADRVPQLLLASARSLRLQFEASGQHSDLRAQLEAIRAFAGNTGIHYKFPTAMYQDLARTCMV